MTPRHRQHPGFPSSRRGFLRGVWAGVLGLSLPEVLARADAATSPGKARQARNVLVIYEEGGISQMDSWDPKPDAPAEHRSPFRPVATRVPGIRFSSLMPRIARHADKLAVVRSMTSPTADHMLGCKEFFKGYRAASPVRFPDIGSVVTHLLGSSRPQLPGYVFCPGANMPNHITSTAFLSPTRRLEARHPQPRREPGGAQLAGPVPRSFGRPVRREVERAPRPAGPAGPLRPGTRP